MRKMAAAVFIVGIFVVFAFAISRGQAADSNSEEEHCSQIMRIHGFLSRARLQCGFGYYSDEMLSEAGSCSKQYTEAQTKQLLGEGMQTFDRNEQEKGHVSLCKQVLEDFPNLIRK
jgi:hypothetical protein